MNYFFFFLLLLCFGQEETLKAGAYVCWCVQSLVTLEQGGNISLINLEAQLETLLEAVVTFNPPGDFISPASAFLSSSVDDSCLLLHRDWTGAETHGVLRPVQRHSGLVEWSWGLHGGGTCGPRYNLDGSEGEGLSNSASPHSLLPLPRFSTAYDAHHGGMHHSVLQSWYLKLMVFIRLIDFNKTSECFS